MVQEPNLDTFVVCRAKDDIGLVQIGEVNPYICLRGDGCRRTSLLCCTYFMVDRFVCVQYSEDKVGTTVFCCRFPCAQNTMPSLWRAA